MSRLDPSNDARTALYTRSEPGVGNTHTLLPLGIPARYLEAAVRQHLDGESGVTTTPQPQTTLHDHPDPTVDATKSHRTRQLAQRFESRRRNARGRATSSSTPSSTASSSSPASPQAPPTRASPRTEPEKRRFDFSHAQAEIEENNHNDDDDDNNNYNNINNSYDATVETPSPSKVRELREKMWDPQERLTLQWKNHPSRPSALQPGETFRPRSVSPSARKKRQPIAASRVTAHYGTAETPARRTESPHPYTRTEHSPPRPESTTSDHQPQSSHETLDPDPPLYSGPVDDETHSDGGARSTPTAGRDQGNKGDSPPPTSRPIPVKPESDVGIKPSPEHVSVASLVARLAAVRRDNPDDALAQIDAILRQESGSMSQSQNTASDLRSQLSLASGSRSYTPSIGTDTSVANVSPPPDAVETVHDEPAEEDVDYADNDDDTSVSSITNPTYLGNHAHRKRGMTAFATTYRRPRPSSLQAYNKPQRHRGTEALPIVSEGPESKRESRRQKSIVTPPATIQVGAAKDSPHVARSATGGSGRPPSPMDVVDDLVEEFFAKGGGAKREVQASASDEIEEKLRRWDAMSTPDREEAKAQTRSFTSGEAQHLAMPYSNARSSASQRSPRSDATEELCSKVTKESVIATPSRRQHPWDSTTPTSSDDGPVGVTSVDGSTGVEVEYTPLDTDLSSSKQTRSSPSRHPYDDQTRQEANRFPIEPMYSFDAFEDAEQVNWGTTPSFSGEQHARSSDLADEFDSAWVDLPSSAFFPESKRFWSNGETDSTVGRVVPLKPEPKIVRDLGTNDSFGNVHKDKSQFHTNSTDYSVPDDESATTPSIHGNVQKIEARVYQSNNRPGARYFPPARVSAPHTSGSYEQGRWEEEKYDTTVTATQFHVNTSPKAPRGLRGFLNRRYNKGNSGTSQVSVGSGSRYSSRYSQKRIHTLFQNGNEREKDYKEMDPPYASHRGGRASLSPSRERSRSLDERRLRHPGKGRKFSRFVPVYDDDDRNRTAQAYS
jgi:hypothetical protein